MKRYNRYPERAIIDADDEVIGGKPALAGTRISLELVLELVAGGQTIDDILDAYPHLDRDKLVQAIEAGLIARETLKAVDAEAESRRLFGKPLHMDSNTDVRGTVIEMSTERAIDKDTEKKELDKIKKDVARPRMHRQDQRSRLRRRLG